MSDGDSEGELEASSFSAIEKALYIEPPELPDNTPDDIKLKIWKEWDKRDSLKRRAHKSAFTRKQKATALPDSSYAQSTIKIGGVHRQRGGGVAIDGSVENDSLEHVIAVPAGQDRHFQPRGKRSGNKKESRKYRRELKRQKKAHLILSKGKPK